MCSVDIANVLASNWQSVAMEEMVETEEMGKVPRGLQEYFQATGAMSTMLYEVKCDRSFCGVSDTVRTASMTPDETV